ncbi:hypothetical protein [Gemella cuniculi]|uniref:hypothetical protein n=1 Tax=Gemella cuniculi TaxID=150240 RepID=UPI000417CCCC|nr:hypothetical protein [Gemella cuniculi]
MKRFFAILTPIIIIFLVIGGTYFYMNSGESKLKNEHKKYISLINDSHDFDAGLSGLETLTTEKAKQVLKNIENEINIASELKNTDSYLKKIDINSASESLNKAEKLDNEKIFSKAIDWLNNDIENYKKASSEISDLDKNDKNYDELLKNIIDKYSFNYNNLKESLLDSNNSNKRAHTENISDNNEKDNKPNENTQQNNSEQSETKKTSSISDSQVHPRIAGQQVPETYYTLRYTQEGSVSRNIIENELKGDISNFTNEEINAAIARYNAKNAG